MLRKMFGSLLLVSVAAERVRTHSFQTQSQLKFGATCEELESSFHDRVGGLQTLLDAHSTETTFNTAARARFSMRVLGVVRTLRRASSCPWVIDGDSADVAQMRGIVQIMFAGNACAQAARAQIEAGSGPDDAIAVGRAMSVLASENCEVSSMTDENTPPMNLDNGPEMESQLDRAEQEAQNSVDDLVDVSMNDEGSAFIEAGSKGRFAGLFRAFGVLLLVLLLLLACTTAAALIGVLIMTALNTFGIHAACTESFCGVGTMLQFMFVGGAVGLVGCAYQLVTELLPQAGLDQPALQ